MAWDAGERELGMMAVDWRDEEDGGVDDDAGTNNGKHITRLQAPLRGSLNELEQRPLPRPRLSFVG